jgi:sulfite reductase alpha subunit-like flavoprotein
MNNTIRMCGISDNTLYFGCQYAHKNQYYRSEWEAYAEEWKLCYSIACSRDGQGGPKQTNVRDLMQNHAQDWKILGQQRGILIVS